MSRAVEQRAAFQEGNSGGDLAAGEGGGLVDANGRFEFERRLGGAVWVVTVSGESGSGTDPGFAAALSVVENAAAVVVDISPALLDSKDLAVLLKHARPGAGHPDRLVVAARPDTPGRRLIDLCGAGRFVPVFDTVAEAVDGVSRTDGRPMAGSRLS